MEKEISIMEALQKETPSADTRPTLTYEAWTQPFELALLNIRDELNRIFREQDVSEQFLDAVWLHFRRNARLQACTSESIQAAGVQLALSGLDITQPGEVWLIPHENMKRDSQGNTIGKELECVVWDGYLGRIKLAAQHPDVIGQPWAETVRQKDTYRYKGRGALPEHTFPQGFDPRGPITGFYAAVQLKHGQTVCIQMSKTEILAHRNQYSRAATSDVWQEHLMAWEGPSGKRQRVETDTENRGFEKMGLKTIISQLCHPRNIPMVRVASAVIAQQERIMESLRPINGHDQQATKPVMAREEAIAEIFPETPREEEEKKGFLDAISRDYQATLYPMVPHAKLGLFCKTLFNSNTWKDVPTLTLAQLKKNIDRWHVVIDTLKTTGVDDDSETWTDDAWLTWISLAGTQTDETNPQNATENAQEAEEATQPTKTPNGKEKKPEAKKRPSTAAKPTVVTQDMVDHLKGDAYSRRIEWEPFQEMTLKGYNVSIWTDIPLADFQKVQGALLGNADFIRDQVEAFMSLSGGTAETEDSEPGDEGETMLI